MPLDRLYADRKYRLPVVPDVTEVAANHIRAAAYVPLQELTPQMPYDKAAVEPNDIDLVTVEGRFDVAELFRRFQASFAGVDVQKEDWRDPCLAKPIFAAVQLERQELQEDGSWSAWRAVPRSRVEANRGLLQVCERIEDLPTGGLDLRLMQFKNEEIATGLLQPEAYQIASAEEEWFPPTYYNKYKDLQRKIDAEKRRDDKEKERKQNDRDVTAPGRTHAAGPRAHTAGAERTTRCRGGRALRAKAEWTRGNTPGGMPGDPMYGGRAGPGAVGEPAPGARAASR